MAMLAYKQSHDDSLEYFKELFLKLRNDHYFGRLGKTFSTNENHYFLDTGTGKVFKVKRNLYLVLTSLLKNDDFEALSELDLKEDEMIDALSQIERAVEKEHILSAPILETMAGEATEDLENSILKRATSLTLELTEECNLRCKYCIYHPLHPSYREFGKKHMSWETAKQAIDFLYQHSRNRNEGDILNFGFYGGEPLLNFEVLESSVTYIKERFNGEEVQYSLTTNAVLLTSKISDYLVENGFSIIISLDGPKELHDENRVFPDETGSFDKVKAGIKNLVQSYVKFNKEPIFAINVVTSNVDANKKYDMIYDFFKDCDWIPDQVAFLCSGIDEGPHKSHYVLPHSEDEKKLNTYMGDLIGLWSDIKTKDYTEYETNYSTDTVNQTLIRIHKRFISNKPSSKYPLNGCCVPGQRKAYVTVNGDILPCERVGTQIPKLGNVHTGFDIKSIKKYYVDEYIEKSKAYCKNCWATNLCAICYNNCYDENGISAEDKHTLCLNERFVVEGGLIRYHKMLEKNPKILEGFNEIELR